MTQMGAIAGDQLNTAKLDDGQGTETVVFYFEHPVGVVKRQNLRL